MHHIVLQALSFFFKSVNTIKFKKKKNLQIVFAATVTTELVTGNSLFRKMDLQGIAEAGGVCLGAITCAAIFAWFSSARSKVGRIFTLSCNTFIDSVIDQIVDGLFYDENEPSDWSDEI